MPSTLEPDLDHASVGSYREPFFHSRCYTAGFCFIWLPFGNGKHEAGRTTDSNQEQEEKQMNASVAIQVLPSVEGEDVIRIVDEVIATSNQAALTPMSALLKPQLRAITTSSWKL